MWLTPFPCLKWIIFCIIDAYVMPIYVYRKLYIYQYDNRFILVLNMYLVHIDHRIFF